MLIDLYNMNADGLWLLVNGDATMIGAPVAESLLVTTGILAFVALVALVMLGAVEIIRTRRMIYREFMVKKVGGIRFLRAFGYQFSYCKPRLGR